MCTRFSESTWSSCAQPSTCPKEDGKKNSKKKNPNWALYVEDIGSYIWLLNLAPEFEQHMKPLSKKSDANLNKKIILHAWSMRF